MREKMRLKKDGKDKDIITQAINRFEERKKGSEIEATADAAKALSTDSPYELLRFLQKTIRTDALLSEGFRAAVDDRISIICGKHEMAVDFQANRKDGEDEKEWKARIGRIGDPYEMIHELIAGANA